MDNEQNYFFTNNITESFNRTLNSFYIKSKKNFFNFQKCLNEIIDFYLTKANYKKKGISVHKLYIGGVIIII